VGGTSNMERTEEKYIHNFDRKHEGKSSIGRNCYRWKHTLTIVNVLRLYHFCRFGSVMFHS